MSLHSPTDEDDAEIDVAFEDTELDYNINISPRYQNQTTTMQKNKNFMNIHNNSGDNIDGNEEDTEIEEPKLRVLSKEKNGNYNINPNLNLALNMNNRGNVNRSILI